MLDPIPYIKGMKGAELLQEYKGKLSTYNETRTAKDFEELNRVQRKIFNAVMEVFPYTCRSYFEQYRWVLLPCRHVTGQEFIVNVFIKLQEQNLAQQK